MNEFTKRDEIIFISYDEVIKNPYPLLLSTIITKYKDVYKDFLSLDKLENMSMDDLYVLCSQRHDKNIFRYLSKKEFNFDKALNDLYHKFNDLFINTDLLPIGNSIHILLSQKFTKKIYIHSKEYDKRIHLDLQLNFRDMTKINYVTGNMSEVISSLEGVTTYIFNDIMDVSYLIGEKMNYTNILVANYGYNYTLNENGTLMLRINLEDMMKKYVFKFSTFIPIDLSEKHINSIEKNKKLLSNQQLFDK